MHVFYLSHAGSGNIGHVSCFSHILKSNSTQLLLFLQPGCVLLPAREMFFLGLQSFAVPFLWVVSTQMDRTFPELFIGM